jgi:hypothetical protein
MHRPTRALSLALLLTGSLAAAPGCATFGREDCSGPQRMLGEAVTREESALVQGLLIALSTRDFEAFQALQPSQHQYLAVAWRHGATRADALARAVQRTGEARRAFTELGDRFVAAGLEARLSPRCTRRMPVNGDKRHPLYALSVDVGPFAVALPVHRSPDRTSLAGTPVIETALNLDTMARAVGIQVALLGLLERASRAEEALLLLNDFLTERAKDLETLRARLTATPWASLGQSELSAQLAAFHEDYAERWRDLQEHRFAEVFESPAFAGFAGIFYPPEASPPGEPSDGDEPETPAEPEQPSEPEAAPEAPETPEPPGQP